MVEEIKKASRVYIIGNGGSAALADHFANDLVKMCGIKAYSLCSNTALLTSLANDNGYENIFVDQLKVYLEKEDVLVTISTSGKSKNIIKAIEYAKNIGANVVSFPTGETMGTEDKNVVMMHNICRIISNG